MPGALNTILGVNILQIGRIFVLLGLAVYAVFALVVVRQVKLMTEVVSGLMVGFLRLIAWLFFLFSIFIFIFTLLVL
ncbi:hypothetical protein COS54_00520 [Candidatus Shapirobacteria bacterium CG03_land_8_20_14_0_80_39_12]|uniref:Uncharacterized protein n=1 Tax=Candidatus Shapirobacteria bacterium CG03_land_8_20_14_0_80_39_12 TaxID=1974879 RepID=A0A2M7BF63_9BACT|nr:MAG: hypothetical protein COS54_00520 [Candidatus Shapirobacteria bacterium CG03_land_8_20_14_0_80_39_12]